jgi:phosphatidylglycerol:prolipoprotein diacylglycerol transferase
MYPVLFEIKDFKIYTYGPLMALGFLVAFGLIYRIARQRQEDVEFYMDLYIWLIIFGLLGAKLLYNVIEYREFIEHPIQSMNCRKGGLVWYGGVIACAGFIIWLTWSNRDPTFYFKKSFPFLVLFPRSSREEKIPLLQITDTLVAPLALGLAIGRVGCLMGGCCYGKPCDLPWAITYPPGPTPVAGIPVHPSPLYESLASLLIAGIIYAVITRKARTGVPTLLWFTLYPIARFLLEYLRGDEVRGFIYKGEIISVSTSQFLGLVIIAIAVAFLARVMNRPPLAIVTHKAVEDRETAARPKSGKAKSAKSSPRPGKSG